MTIDAGSHVTFLLNGVMRTCTIVYVGGGNPANGTISSDAPLAQLMLGRREGERVQGNVPAGEVIIEIIKVDSAARR